VGSASGNMRAGVAAAVQDGRARRGRCARIAGYHLTALALIARRSRCRAHAPRSLLSGEGIAFPASSARRTAHELPDPGSTSCFEERVRAHRTPSAPCTATDSGPTRRSTARANQLARALLGGVVPRRRHRCGDRAQPGLDGRLSSRSSRVARTSPSSRIFPVRSHRRTLFPRRLPAGLTERGSTG